MRGATGQDGHVCDEPAAGGAGVDVAPSIRGFLSRENVLKNPEAKCFYFSLMSVENHLREQREPACTYFSSLGHVRR